MPRKQKVSRALQKAFQRAASLRSISETLDFGNGLTLNDYESNVEQLRLKVSEYNAVAAQLDQLGQEVKTAEKAINKHSERMLAAVGAVYGKDSVEYGKAGGVRTSMRKPPAKKKKVEADSSVASTASV